MAKKTIWMNPRAFCKQFWNNPELLVAIIRVNYKDGDEAGRDIALRLMNKQPVTLQELYSKKPSWNHGYIHGVARVPDYVAGLKAEAPGVRVLTFPVVDKKHNLIFDVNGAHEALAEFLFTAYEGLEAAPFGERGAQYVLKGYGYYRSSVSIGGFWVGEILFDHGKINDDDDYIFQNGFTVVETVADFLHEKRRLYNSYRNN